ncbi:MAG TPA: hypothetical protein P5089_01150 [Candidatus Portnoybacteria bacterium]|nr:hypothetical protein [Candidatus Portnoybacteria bacterium]
MFSKKQVIILIILLFVLVGAILLYWQKYGKWSWQEEVQTVPSTATASPGATSSVLPGEKGERDIVMEDVAAKIASLSPEAPVLGGKWFVDRFWFVDGSNNSFYVEYEDGHILRELFLLADTSQAPDKISYTQKAYFTPGESGWMLQSGQDDTSGRSLILYEYSQDSGRWVKKN